MRKHSKALGVMLALVMVLAVALSMTACGSKSDESSDDGQNPVMNFIGCYLCDRAEIVIGAEGDDEALVTVTWGSSAFENSSWVMNGTFDPETLQIEYHDCVRTDYVYSEEGEVTSEEEVYTGGHGFITFAEGDTLTLTWQDDQEHIADGMTFTYAGAAPGEGDVGMPNPWSDVDSAEEAAKGAGLDEFVVPEGLEISLGTVEVAQYRCMEGIADAETPIAAVDMTIRKGKKDLEIAEGDISGDYGEYKYDWNMTIGDVEVKCFGNREGEATKTIWSNGEYDYAILAFGAGGDDDFGLNTDDLTALVSGIR